MKSVLSLLCTREQTHFKQTDKLNDEEDRLDSIAVRPKITWEHRWPFDETQDALLNSPFLSMPTEMMLKIFALLSVRNLGNASLVCRYFKMVVDHDTIWQAKCHLSKKLSSKSYKQIYIDWIYTKYLRNNELKQVEKQYRTMTTGCGCRYYSPSIYFVRSINNESFVPFSGFNQHPNSSSDVTIQLSVDFDKTVHALILLSEKISKFQKNLRKSVILEQMIRRYHRFMQLKVLYPKNLLIPTIDIEIVWQTHLLRPLIYQLDCLRLFGQIIDHSLLLNDTEQAFKEEAFLYTSYLYEKHFHEQYCSLLLYKNYEISLPEYIHPYFDIFQCLTPIYSYWDETYVTFSSHPLDDFENPFSFTETDIILDEYWITLCKHFMNNIFLKIYIDILNLNPLKPIDLSSSAVKRLKKSYERFLYITAKYPPTEQNDLIYPTYAIDIIWHCHMQEPLKYANDCNRLLGHLIDHYPWPSIDKYQIKQSCYNLNQYWREEFQNDMLTDHLRNN